MAFDAKAYRSKVLSQYSRAKEPQLRHALGELRADSALRIPSKLDLVELYAIPSGIGGSELAAHVAAVAGAMKVAMSKPGGSRQPFDLHELLAARNPDLREESFWTAVVGQRREQALAALTTFGQDAAVDFGALQVVTSERLREAATRSGVTAEVSDADLANAVQAHGITVVDAFVPPTVPAQAIRDIGTQLRKTSARSVVSVVLLADGEPATFSVLPGAPTPTAPVSLAAVAASAARVERLGDTDEVAAFKVILSAIAGAARTDADVAAIVVAHFLDVARLVLQEMGQGRATLAALVERTGLDRVDAGRMLLHVGDAGGGAPRGYPEVDALIAAGALKEARRLYDATLAEVGGSTSDMQERVLAMLEGVESRVAALRATAAAAQGEGDLEGAARALDEALTLCSDDMSLAKAAQALPPAAPVRFVATVTEDGRTTRLGWEPGFGSSDDVRFQVIRKLHSPPRNNSDGTTIAQGLTATTFEDASAPIATRAYYGVSASRGGGSSPVAVADVLALPPVREVVVTAEPTSLSLRWTAPPEASAIEVMQQSPDGTRTPLSPGTQHGATSSGLQTGATYAFFLTAVYADGAGAASHAETVRVTAVPRGEARPASALVVSEVDAGSADSTRVQVAAEWPRVEGYPIEVWHFAAAPVWRAGDRVPLADVRARGVQLAGRSSTAGRVERLVGVTEHGLRHYVVLTRDGDVGIVGAVAEFGTAPPVANVRAERFGDEVVVSWDWPSPDLDVRVRWSGSSQGERRISMGAYRTAGGCRIPMGAGGGELLVAAVGADGEGDWASAEVSVAVPGASRAIAYDVAFRKRLIGGPSAATLRFDLPAEGAQVDVVVVGHRSRFMPFDATQGGVLARATVTSASPIVEVVLPKGGSGPLWVRAFAVEASDRLVDPSPTSMKVA